MGQRDRRRHPRLERPSAASRVGEVLDLSESGMRVFFKGALPVQVGERFDAELRHPGINLSLAAQVRRIDKVGFRRYEIGLTFLDPDERTLRDLRDILEGCREERRGPSLWIAA